MKRVSCKELDIDCDTTVTGEDDEQVIEGVFSHLNEVHEEHAKAMTEEDRLECINAIKELLESTPE